MYVFDLSVLRGTVMVLLHELAKYRVNMEPILFGLGLLIFGQIPCHFIYGISNEMNRISVGVV